MLDLYRTVTQYLSIINFSVAGMLAMFAQPVLFALTGNQAAAEWGAPVLFWFVLGNGILVIVGMQYTLQFAHGQTRLHVISTSINAAIQVPIMAYVAYNHGAVAVAIAWFLIRLTTFFVWPAIVHKRFAPGLHWKWVGHDILPPLLGVAVGLGMVYEIIEQIPAFVSTRGLTILSMTIGVGVVILFGSVASINTRNKLISIVRI